MDNRRGQGAGYHVDKVFKSLILGDKKPLIKN